MQLQSRIKGLRYKASHRALRPMLSLPDTAGKVILMLRLNRKHNWTNYSSKSTSKPMDRMKRLTLASL